MPSSDQILSLSCTVVGVGPGGSTSMLARVAITDFRGENIYERYVAPTLQVTDYRTGVTGITEEHLSRYSIFPLRRPVIDPCYAGTAYKFSQVQRQVADIIRNKTIVGHQLWNDLSVLGIPHPAVDTRDVALYQPFRNALNSPNHIVGLQSLCWHLMRRRCQDGQQNPIENARAALDLYRSHGTEWESAIRDGHWPCALPPSTFARCYL
ncbi:uncharacterized protein STEHIDRAFT_46712 [Stereum hirsutum FP-91666 SS1]|uniref:uncharacterized protein n=1 Tax=Stereum hirsutum (strain FP-91666) TaxID=721885 RepID=UPI000440E1A7|nr:uncharacterized protein STEHIDRAFT_46712 [Stereum hirsutum FP-91666 SS1]EIM92605.1 hypothetical protein STEHIDRAFT_46712 [Stereum hirsutum FP-91666 SS1]